MLAANLHHDLKEFWWRSNEATFAQNRFGNHRSNIFGGHDPAEGVFQMARTE